MTSPTITHSPTVRHRVEGPTAAIHIVIAQAIAWAVWSVHMFRWVRDYADWAQDRVLTSKAAPLPGVVLVGVVVVAVVGAAVNW